MVNKIIEGVAKALDQTFGDGYEIYQNDISQGFEEPCFFIAVLQSSYDRIIGKHWLLTVSLDVHFFPASGRDNHAMLETAYTLTDALALIELQQDEYSNGRAMSFSIVDNVLHFMVTYQVTLMTESDDPNMETLEAEVVLSAE